MVWLLERTREMAEVSMLPLLFFCAVVTCLDAGSSWLRCRAMTRGGGDRDSSG